MFHLFMSKVSTNFKTAIRPKTFPFCFRIARTGLARVNGMESAFLRREWKEAEGRGAKPAEPLQAASRMTPPVCAPYMR